MLAHVELEWAMRTEFLFSYSVRYLYTMLSTVWWRTCLAAATMVLFAISLLWYTSISKYGAPVCNNVSLKLLAKIKQLSVELQHVHQWTCCSECVNINITSRLISSFALRKLHDVISKKIAPGQRIEVQFQPRLATRISIFLQLCSFALLHIPSKHWIPHLKLGMQRSASSVITMQIS